jgi:hypothetical protein
MMNELDFQLIWKHLLFDSSGLTTYTGAVVRILDPGTHNHSDGPDFLNARIALDDILFYGHVELHLEEEDWYRHGHHTDPNYNNVVLHVCLKQSRRGFVTTQSGEQLPQIVLENRLRNSIQGKSGSNKGLPDNLLPCHFAEPAPISEDVVRRQEMRAYHAYFEDKISALMQWYDPSLDIRTAVVGARLCGLAHYFGRPHNESAFVAEVERSFGIENKIIHSGQFIPTQIVEFKEKLNRKEVRPVLLSEKRLGSVDAILRRYALWKPSANAESELRRHLSAMKWIKSLPATGPVTSSVIERCVLLPSLALWARLVHHQDLFSEVQRYWMGLSAGHGRTVEYQFPEFIAQNARKKGTKNNFLLYQFKSYCTERACDQCLFMKNACGG